MVPWLGRGRRHSPSSWSAERRGSRGRDTHQVVSVRRTPRWLRTAAAQASGPSRNSRSRHPGGGAKVALLGMAGGCGVAFAGGGPTAPGWFGPFTTCEAAVACSAFQTWILRHTPCPPCPWVSGKDLAKTLQAQQRTKNEEPRSSTLPQNKHASGQLAHAAQNPKPQTLHIENPTHRKTLHIENLHFGLSIPLRGSPPPPKKKRITIIMMIKGE
jgi:hypothetical protein